MVLEAEYHLFLSVSPKQANRNNIKTAINVPKYEQRNGRCDYHNFFQKDYFSP
jgi:hypothetical protein